jgi:hypothetical protein
MGQDRYSYDRLLLRFKNPRTSRMNHQIGAGRAENTFRRGRLRFPAKTFPQEGANF